MSKLHIDLNADLGEGAGHDDELLQLVSSANIATGFHAGDANTMRTAIAIARDRGVAAGAHPSLFDRANFGRKELNVAAEEVYDAVVYQAGVFEAIAEPLGVKPAHVKPHGALYNMAARDAALADAVVRAIKAVNADLLLLAPSGSQLELAAHRLGLGLAREVFADRNYLADGALVPRTRPDALLHDPNEAADRVIQILEHGTVQSVDGKTVRLVADTVCVHGDTPGAVEFVRALRSRLERAGVAIKSPAAE